MAARLASSSPSHSSQSLSSLFYNRGEKRKCLVARLGSGESGMGMERAVWVDGKV
jgi:hypothetical protein